MSMFADVNKTTARKYNSYIVLVLLLVISLACSIPALAGDDVVEELTGIGESPEKMPNEEGQSEDETSTALVEQSVPGSLQAAQFYLSDYGYFDFDHGTGIEGFALVDGQPAPAAPDILFYNDHIVLQEGASLAVWSGQTPDLASCQSAPFSDQDLLTEDLNIGVYVCIQTSDGRVGFFTVDDLYLDSYGDLVMGFSYTLWDADGSELPAFRALHTITGITYPRGSSGLDLDFYRNHQVPDLVYQYPDIETLEIHPAGPAEIAYFGAEIPSYEDCAALALSDEPQSLGMVIFPGMSPLKEQQFFCFRTNEGRLGRMYQKTVYFDSSLIPLPYGDAMASLDFNDMYSISPGEGADFVMEYSADTWVLDDEPPSSLVPVRRDEEGMSGRVILPYADSFDFDSGSTMMDFRSLQDVDYHGDDETQQAAFFPANEDILLSAMGGSEPGFQDCMDADLANKPAFLEKGQYYCVKTSTGRYAAFLVNGFYFDAAAALDSSLTMFSDISYKTWTLDGEQHLVHAPALALDDGGDWLYPGEYDLDMVLGSGITDLTMAADNEEQVTLIPAAGSSLAYWGVRMPTQSDCAGLPLGTEPATVEIYPIQPTEIEGYNVMRVAPFYCYQTDEGRRGVLQVSGSYNNLEAGQLYLMVSAETWLDSPAELDQIGAMRDTEMALSTGEAAEPGEMPELPQIDASGESVSGEIRMPNVTGVDFFNGVVLYDDAVTEGDILVEYSPETLEGCFIANGSLGSILGEVPGDLESLELTEDEALLEGCLPIAVNTVYSVFRIRQPEGVVFFRVLGMDADGIDLEYILK